ncbi:MAG: hypothetical protein J6386_01225 [Candidatus Synoicihabitans palmerolidicus]|nr:hypothetical protein [Candidatus Synoicihabitans palmerolidicus]
MSKSNNFDHGGLIREEFCDQFVIFCPMGREYGAGDFGALLEQTFEFVNGGGVLGVSGGQSLDDFDTFGQGGEFLPKGGLLVGIGT